MNRIVVIGSLGGGKSTLSRRLSEIIGVPIVKLADVRMKDIRFRATNGSSWKPS